MICCRAFLNFFRYCICISNASLQIFSADFPVRESLRPTWNIMSVTLSGFSVGGMLAVASVTVYRFTRSILVSGDGLRRFRFRCLPFESVTRRMLRFLQ